MYCVWNEGTVFAIKGDGDDDKDDNDDIDYSLFLGPQPYKGFDEESAPLKEKLKAISKEKDKINDSRLQQLAQIEKSQKQVKAAITDLYQVLQQDGAGSNVVSTCVDDMNKFIAQSKTQAEAKVKDYHGQWNTIKTSLNQIKGRKLAHNFAMEQRSKYFRTTATKLVAYLQRVFKIDKWKVPIPDLADGEYVGNHDMSIIWIFVRLPVYLTKKIIYKYLGYRYLAATPICAIVGALKLLSTEYGILDCSTDDSNGESSY